MANLAMNECIEFSRIGDAKKTLQYCLFQGSHSNQQLIFYEDRNHGKKDLQANHKGKWDGFLYILLVLFVSISHPNSYVKKVYCGLLLIRYC